MRRRVFIAGVLGAALSAAPAVGAGWPVAGGDPSRSGAAFLDAGDAPVGVSWVRPDARVRTPIVVTAGGGPDVQRVVYGTQDGRLHLHVLGTGAPVGPDGGILLDSGTITNEGSTFGANDGAVAAADTSTEDVLGHLLVPHNDQSSVQVAHIDARTGARVQDDVPVASSFGCHVNSAPLITPPDATGARVLFFTMTGSCLAGESLVRMTLPADGSRLGAPTFVPVAGIAELASPALVVLRDASGAPRFHVAVGRTGGVTLFDASNVAAPPITASFATAAEVARTPAAPAADTGDVAGADGSGTDPAPALYVAADDAGQTRVYRFVQDGNARELRRDRTVGPLPNAGAPGPALAVSEAVTPAGVTPGGRLVVTSATNLTVLRTQDLGVVAQLSPSALPAAKGFSRVAPAVSGQFAYVARNGDAGTVPEHLVVRLDGLAALTSPAFTPAPDNTAGSAFGQPAISRGWIVLGGPSGAIAYRNRDVTPPLVELADPGPALTSSSTVRARAFDARGIASVQFRLLDQDAAYSLGRAATPDAGSPLLLGGAPYSLFLAGADVPDGDYQLEAIATDAFGNAALSAARRVRVSGLVGAVAKPACTKVLTGTARSDRIIGTALGERIVGGRGDDRIDGAGGDDCVFGQSGEDVLAGGTGGDLLDGGKGDDTLAGGSGRNHLAGGAGADVLRGGRSADRIDGGAGRDTILGGAGADRLTGGSGNDVLRGESGDDRIDGGSGNDAVVGGPGRNQLAGGSGNDRISARNRRRDVIRCGRGRDRVSADRIDRVAADCERVSRR
jgi:hypothetical protein